MLSKYNKNKKVNNDGVALISVIVVIAFIATLASIVLTTTLVNFKMKAVNVRAKDTFYSAEQVLDEVNAYLQRIVSDSMSDAYSYVMKNFSEDSSRDKKDKMALRYYENLWNALEVSGSGHAYYDVAKLESQLRNSTVWHTYSGAVGQEYGGILVAVDADGNETKSGEMITYTKDGVVLKNLKVYYKDAKGFVSVIQTDIRLGNPDFDFAKSSQVPDISEFALVGDTKVSTENLSNLTIDGNLYANQLELFSGRTKGSVTVDAKSKIISKYDFSLKNTNLRTESGVEVWTKNVVVDSSKFDFNGDLYVENDLNIKGKESDVTLKGKYIGYGNGGKEEIANSVEQRYISGDDISYKSSSIVVNGIESKLDLRGLTQFNISGRAYIGASGGDITTGESIAVKSDQMMYLVPPSAIGRVKKGDKIESYYNKNPLTSTEIENLRTMLGVTTKDELIDYEVELPELNDNNLNYYMSEDLTDAHGNILTDEDGKVKLHPRTIKCKLSVVPLNDGTNDNLTYFYMDFSSAGKANLYYSDYYKNDKERSDKFLDYYADSIRLPDTTYYTKTAGNYAFSSTVDGKKVYDIKPDTAGAIEYNQKTIDLNDEYTGIFDSYTKHLVPFREGVNNRAIKFENKDDPTDLDVDKEDLRLVYNQLFVEAFLRDNFTETDPTKKNMMVSLVEKGELDAFGNAKFTTQNTYDTRVLDVIAKSSENGKIWTFETAADGILAYICVDPSRTIDTSDAKYQNLKLLVTAGKVTLGRDFNGLLIAKKEIVVKSGVSVIASDKTLVDDVLRFEVGNGDFFIANIFKDGENYSRRDNKEFTLRDYIVYENWKKE